MVTVCPSQFATRRTLFHVLVGCGLLMLKGSRLKHQQATTNQNVKKRPACSELRDRKSGSAGMPRPISYAVFCLKKKKGNVYSDHNSSGAGRQWVRTYIRDPRVHSVGEQHTHEAGGYL